MFRYWGDPKNYAITVNRSGSGFETDYVVQGVPQVRSTQVFQKSSNRTPSTMFFSAEQNEKLPTTIDTSKLPPMCGRLWQPFDPYLGSSSFVKRLEGYDR
jgi:hypothetical protein